jgi:hypothetical protein
LRLFFKLLSISLEREQVESPIFAAVHGGLAQLARALAWHARGRRFDSDILHYKTPFEPTRRVFFLYLSLRFM